MFDAGAVETYKYNPRNKFPVTLNTRLNVIIRKQAGKQVVNFKMFLIHKEILYIL